MIKLPPFLRYDLPVLIKMLLPTVFIVAIGWHFEEFVIGAVEANVAINSGIIVTALYGVVIIMLRLIDVQRDMRGLDRFSREARATGDMQDLLQADWLKGRSIRHYLEHLAHTEGRLASQLDQDAIQNELGALQEEYNSKMEMPQFLVGFMIAMGLLGTFIGLLETLTGIAGMLDGMGHGGDIEKEFSKLIVELRKPLAGMGIAFSASMFGLVTSLQLSIMMIFLRRYTSRVMEKARSVMHTLIIRTKVRHVAAEGSNEEGVVLSGGDGGGSGGGGTHVDMSFMGSHEMEGGYASGGGGGGGGGGSNFADMITDAYFRSQDAIATMATNVTMLSKRLESVSKAIESSIEVTQKTNTLLSFGPRMNEAQDQLIEEVKGLATSQSDGQKLVQKIISSMIQIDQSLYAINTKDIVLGQREVISTLSEMFNNSQTHTRMNTEMIEAQREGSHELVNALKLIQDRMKKQDEISAATSDHIREIKESLGKALPSFSSIDLITETVSKQATLIEASLAEERATQKAMIMTFQKELRAMTEELRHALEKPQPKPLLQEPPKA